LIEWVEAVKAAKASGLSAEEAITRLDANAPRAAAPAASVMGTRTNVYGVWQYLDSTLKPRGFSDNRSTALP
jgi:hypothetical protein